MNLEKELEDLRKELKDLKGMLEQPAVVGEFQKVSFEQFEKDYIAEDNLTVEEVYKDILALPVRSSIGSAGHDFVLTKRINLNVGDSIKIETGIKVKIKKGWVLLVTPRSGLGTKFRLQLDNTIGVIDEDYYNNSGNEGHMFIMITNDGKEGKSLVLEAGDRFAQGIFVPYGIANHDKPLGDRVGGGGSSGL